MTTDNYSNNSHGMGDGSSNENSLYNKYFYISYFITVAIVCGLPALWAAWIAWEGGGELGTFNGWALLQFAFCAPSIPIGFFLWAIVQHFFSRAAGMGILSGSLTSLIVVLILSGSCLISEIGRAL
jgi:hypothetical protein